MLSLLICTLMGQTYRVTSVERLDVVRNNPEKYIGREVVIPIWMNTGCFNYNKDLKCYQFLFRCGESPTRSEIFGGTNDPICYYTDNKITAFLKDNLPVNPVFKNIDITIKIHKLEGYDNYFANIKQIRIDGQNRLDALGQPFVTRQPKSGTTQVPNFPNSPIRGRIRR